MQRSAGMEVELLNYWLSMRKLNALFRMRVCMPADIEDAKTELEAMMLNTDWPLLRTRCLEAVGEADRRAMSEDVA